MFSKSRFNNTFDDFRHERKIRNRTIVRELEIVRHVHPLCTLYMYA